MRLERYVLASADRWPERPALELATDGLTYSRLLGEVDQRRAALALAGLDGRGAPIGIFTAKGVAAYSGLLAVMASGNIYVPLDIRHPPARLAAIARTVRLAAIICDSETRDRAEALARSCNPASLLINGDGEHILPSAAQERDGLAPVAASDRDTAYILFTSGSSGTPKGIPVSHASASACIEATDARFPIAPNDRIAQMSNLAFDVSIGEMFLCWRAGACLAVPAETEHAFPSSFIDRCRPTIWSSVPTAAANLRALGAVRPSRFSSIRLSLFCGEPLPADLALAWQAATPAGQVVNVYGPTETAIFATTHVLDPAEPMGATVPIGTPLEGMRHRIAAGESRSSPEPGRAGELLLAGPQVFSGYLANDAATAAAFERFDDAPDTRWYRTGDLVRAGADGVLTFCGRTNRELKIRGSRVDLLEVERVVREVCSADLVAVVPIGAGDGRYDELVAFTNRLDLDRDRLARELRQHLPDYMIPSRVQRLDELPLTASGKVDYVRLERVLAEASHEEAQA